MISAFLLNLFLAMIYVLLTGHTGSVSFIIGFLIGYFVIWIYGLAVGGPNYPSKVYKLIRYGFWFMYILTKANMQIAWEVITPGMHQTPRIIRYPVEELTDVETTTLANSITLTPGTLVVDISEDGKWLYVHCMYAQDRESAVAELDLLKDRLQLEVFSA